jgi:hypothetical protein
MHFHPEQVAMNSCAIQVYSGKQRKEMAAKSPHHEIKEQCAGRMRSNHSAVHKTHPCPGGSRLCRCLMTGAFGMQVTEWDVHCIKQQLRQEQASLQALVKERQHLDKARLPAYGGLLMS